MCDGKGKECESNEDHLREATKEMKREGERAMKADSRGRLLGLKVLPCDVVVGKHVGAIVDGSIDTATCHTKHYHLLDDQGEKVLSIGVLIIG